METEHKFSTRIVGQLRRCNAIVLNIHGEKMQAVGWPDIYICHRYFKGFVEIKGQHTQLKANQRAIIRKLKERGQYACVLRYPDLIQNEDGRLIHKLEEVDGLTLIKALQEINERYEQSLRGSSGSDD